MHKHSIALALTTTLAVGAFAVLPVTTALASDTGDQATVETTAPLTVPAAPTHVKTRTLDADQVRVTWRAGSDGGSAITGFTVVVTSSSGVATSADALPTDRSVQIAGLVSDTRYRATVTATNTVGTSAASIVSNTARTDRSALGKAADRAEKAAAQAEHDAAKAAKNASKAAKKAAKAQTKAAKKAAHQAAALARLAARQAAALAKKADR
ncbi:MAG: Fibronectin type domain, partial [Blastococcus sp.]|nr:Fibronectin type domain [Blastococcus sp.]